MRITVLSRLRKNSLPIAGAVLGLAAGLAAHYVYAVHIRKAPGCGAADGKGLATDGPRLALSTEGPTRGPAGAQVVIVEWSDFQCPYCAKMEETLNKVQAKHGARVRLVYRHFPLPFHPLAMPAARAAAAAEMQGRFWEMHDFIFQHQGQLAAEGDYSGAATNLGLDPVQFLKNAGGQEVAERLRADQAEASRLGVVSTPTFFVNGRPIVGFETEEPFNSMIDEELKNGIHIGKESP